MKTSDLRDDFADNIEASAWSASLTGGSATKAETGGQARLTLPSSTAGSHQAYYRTAGVYDLTGDAATWNIDTMVATGVAATATLDVYLDGSNVLRWQQVSGTLTARKIVAGVDTSLFSATWSSSTHKYLRIRESGGTVFFDSSTNGSSWTNRASLANPFAVTGLTVQFGASCGNVASPGSLRIEEYNIVPGLATPWHATTGQRPQVNRFKQVTISATAGQFYLATATALDTSGNLVSPQYWSGPLDGDGMTLTSQASQAAAQAMAVNATAGTRFDLPTQVEARYVRLYHRSLVASSSYRLDEYYPRRLVQADDIEAESIRAIHIAAASITADRLFVVQLSAITADLGTITAGTITGATIQTAASGARLVLNASNLNSYDASNNVLFTLDGQGMLISSATETTPNIFFGSRVSTDAKGRLFGVLNSSSSYTQGISAYNGQSLGSSRTISAKVIADNTAFSDVFVIRESGGTTVDLFKIAESTGTISSAGGLNLDLATGAPEGGIHMTEYIQFEETSQPATPAANKMRQWVSDDGAGNTGVFWVDSTGTPMGFTCTTAATATTGASGAPPAQVAGYLIGFIGGARRKIPFYNI